MTEKKYPKEVIIAAIAAIVVCEVVALLKGFNGTLLTIVVAAIAALGGWAAPQLKTK